MNPDTSLRTLIDEVILLAKQQAKGRSPKLVLSKETMALLNAIGQDGVMSQQAEKVSDVYDQKTPVAEIESNEVEKDMQEKSLPPNASLTEKNLAAIVEEVAACRKCPLGELRNNTVPGEGDPNAKLVFVGEAPGADEDRTGRPFVGRAGQLLTKIIVNAMDMRREDVFICNVLKCRPPENRVPNPEEVMLCEPYLLQQLDIIKPKVICALGATAAQTLLKTKEPIKNLRGVWHNYHDIPFRVTYHPAYLLRNPPDKRKAWDDVKEILRVLRGEITPDI